MSSAETRSVSAGGARFSYLDQGAGEPLVLLHGIGSGARSWRPQLAELSKDFRVMAWDAPGYGASDVLPTEHPLAAEYAAALGRLLDALRAPRVHLVGHSLGTVIALAFAAAYPQRVATLTLASLSSGHARLRMEERERLRSARLDDLSVLGPEGMAQKRGPRLLGPKATEAHKQAVIETMSLIRPEGYTQAVWMLSRADTSADLARLPADLPVQIVYGDADVVTPPEGIRKVAAARPDAPQRVLSGAGHALYIEQPAEFSALLRSFATGGGHV